MERDTVKMDTAAGRDRVIGAAACWTVLALTFLAPYKFGNLVGVPEADPVAPVALLELLFSTWPSALFSVLAGAGLLLALAAWPPAGVRRSPLWIQTGLWLAVFLVSFLGIVNATVPDYYLNEIGHLAGVMAYLVSVTLMLGRHPEWQGRVLNTLAVAWIGLVVAGLWQYFVGFDEMRQFVEQQEAAGQVFSEEMRHRLLDTRITAGFTSCNTFAGVMLLLTPPVLWRFWSGLEKLGGSRGACIAFTVLALALGGWVFLGARSRAAFLALAAALVIYVWCFVASRKWKLAIALGALLAVVAGGAYIARYGRGFSSMVVRVDYYVAGAKLLAQHPLAGAGWGEFGQHYMRLKVFDIDEASQDPHSMVMTMASQCGIPGLLAILAAAGFLLWAGWRRARYGGRRERLIWIGLTAFFLHALAEFHFQSVGAMAPALALGALLLTGPEAPAWCWRRGRRLAFAAAMGILALVSLVMGVGWLRSEYAYSELVRLAGDPSSTMVMVEEQLERFNRLRPGSPYGYLTAGDYFRNRRQTARAEQLYLRAVEHAPENVQGYGRLAMLLRQRDPAAAARWAREALIRSPGDDKYLEIAAPGQL